MAEFRVRKGKLISTSITVPGDKSISHRSVMLGAIAEMVPTIRSAEGVHVDLAHLPHDDPAVYEILNRADTVGLFQVESRTQMASLPRSAPRCFYDLVIQVAIIRPMLNARTDLVLAGAEAGESQLHTFYIAADVLLLLGLGVGE